MALPANVTPLSEGRAPTQNRVTYRAADGKQKETYLGIPSSLLPRLYEASLAEVRLLLYVWQRTGGWKDYHAHPQPVRITFAEWTGGRPGYAQDTGAHLCIQEIITTRDTLVARGWLYEEWETPHVRGPRRYALIAPDIPGVGPYQREDGTWEVLLLTEEGPQPYQIPEAVLQPRTADEALLQDRKEPLLPRRRGSSTASKSALLHPRREKSRRTFPGAGPAHPITNVLANTPTKQGLAKGAADAARTPEQVLQGTQADELSDVPSRAAHEGSDDPGDTAVGAAQAPAIPPGKPSLFPAQAPTPASVPRSSASSGKQGKRKRTSSKPKAVTDTPETQAALEARRAALLAVWRAHPATVPEAQMSETERRRFYSGIAKLAGSSLTLEEVPALLDAQARWSRGTYTPDPHTLEASLGTLRREAAAWKKTGNTPQKGTTHVGRHAGAWSGEHGRDDELVIKC